MISVICFDLIPEALNITSISITICGILFGIFIMIICNKFIENLSQSKNSLKLNSMLKTGIIIAIGLSIHNFPEGLAIGAGIESSTHLGFKLAIAIALHDVPEGLSISLPLKTCGVSKLKAIMLTAFSGLTTGLGALLGAIIGTISETLIGMSLAFAAGAMLYIVSCELIPESKRIYTGRFSSLGNIFGIICGILTQYL